MIVCVCTAVTESQIRRAVAEGATSLEDLRVRLGVDTGCGCCAEEAERIMQRCLLEMASSRPAVASAVSHPR